MNSAVHNLATPIEQTSDTPSLECLLASRLCHDFASPLAAIQSSLELLDMTGGLDDEIHNIFNSSTMQAVARVEFFRTAFGVARNSENISLNALRQRMCNHYAIEDITLSAQAYEASGIPRLLSQEIALGTLCLQSSFSMLQSMDIKAGKGEWRILAKGRGATLSSGVRRASDEWRNTAEISARNVHFSLFFKTLQDNKSAFQTELSGPDLILEVKTPHQA